MTSDRRFGFCLTARSTRRPGTSVFVRNMVAMLQAELEHEENTVTLTYWQDKCLMEKVHRYRRQHGRCKCMVCLKETMKKDNPYQGSFFGEL